MTAVSQLVTFTSRDDRVVRVTTIIRVALVGLLVGNLGRIPVFSTGDRDAPVLLNDLLVAAMLCAGLAAALRARALRVDSTTLFAAAFAVVGGASTLLSIPRFGLDAFETAVSLGYLARWIFYFLVYVVGINAIRRDEAWRVWQTLELLVLIFAAFGVIQSIALPNFAQTVYPSSRLRADWDPQGHRLVSTWLDPVFAGAFIMIGLLMQLAQVAVARRVSWWKPVLLVVALILTASRAALLATAVGVIVIVLARGLSKRLLRAGVLLGGLALVAIPIVIQFTGLVQKLGVDASALQRFIAWTRGAKVFLDHPVVGIGFNAWGFVQERYGYERLYAFSYSLDGGLIFVAVMTGIIGLALYVGMLTTILRRARRTWRDDAVTLAHRGLAIGVAASTVALVVDALFGNSLFLPFLMETIAVVWAILFAVSQRAGDGSRRAAT